MANLPLVGANSTPEADSKVESAPLWSDPSDPDPAPAFITKLRFWIRNQKLPESYQL